VTQEAYDYGGEEEDFEAAPKEAAIG
jgi:hypothetical protein